MRFIFKPMRCTDRVFIDRVIWVCAISQYKRVSMILSPKLNIVLICIKLLRFGRSEPLDLLKLPLHQDVTPCLNSYTSVGTLQRRIRLNSCLMGSSLHGNGLITKQLAPAAINSISISFADRPQIIDLHPLVRSNSFRRSSCFDPPKWNHRCGKPRVAEQIHHLKPP